MVFLKKTKNIQWLIASAMIALTIALGYFTQQSEFPKIIVYYSLFFGLYIGAYISFENNILNHNRFCASSADSPLLGLGAGEGKCTKPIMVQYKIPGNNKLDKYIGLAILLRLILVFALPNLSNDVYRFIWDGRLLVQGHNPFDHLPVYYLENGNAVEGITRELFEAYGSKNFFTVYPPVAQAQFASACWLFPKSIYWSSVVMKLWLFLFELGSIFLIIKLLKHFKLPKKNVLLYALNPLIIFEITGNLHFEGAMVFFLLLAMWLLVKNKINLSAIAFALSICSKLLTLLFLPFLIKKIGWGRSTRYFIITGAATVLFFLPIVNATFISNFGDSLNLYFQKLEYNASLYYLFRWIGFQVSGYNQIAQVGPALGALAVLGILGMALYKVSEASKASDTLASLPGNWLFAICLYLFCTTTMHPWYTALPIVLCVFTKYRFPIVWSYLIFWTYINYGYVPYRENLWVVGMEYLIVFAWLLWERKRYVGKMVF